MFLDSLSLNCIGLIGSVLDVLVLDDFRDGFLDSRAAALLGGTRDLCVGTGAKGALLLTVSE